LDILSFLMLGALAMTGGEPVGGWQEGSFVGRDGSWNTVTLPWAGACLREKRTQWERNAPAWARESRAPPGYPPPVRRLLAIVVPAVVLAAVGPVLWFAGLLPAAWAAIIAGFGGFALLAVLVAASALPGLQVWGPAVLRGPSVPARVALTFDDGPDPVSTPALLMALEQAGARATFFVLLDRAEQHPALLKAIAQRHEVALHGPAHHPGLVFADPAAGATALKAARTRLAVLCGRAPRWYRPPFGVTSPRLARAIEAAGLRLVWCSLRTLDGVAKDPERLRRVCAQAVAGDIVLLHEGPRAAAAALPVILSDLRARGLEPTTVGALLERTP
jgi:peptidoglycan/xylan/chitin deacetylase (PgdA/CDA1 family)